MRNPILAAAVCLTQLQPSFAAGYSTLAGSTARSPTPAFAPAVEALKTGDLGNFVGVDPGILAPYVSDVADMAREPGHYGALAAPDAWAEALPHSLLIGLAGSQLSGGDEVPASVTPRRAATEYVAALASREGALEGYLKAHEDKRAAGGLAQEGLEGLDLLAGILRGLGSDARARFVERLDRVREAGAKFQGSKNPAVLEEFWRGNIRHPSPGPELDPAPSADDEAALIALYLDPAHVDGRPKSGQGRWVEDPGYRMLHLSNAEILFPGGRPPVINRRVDPPLTAELIDPGVQLAYFKLIGAAAPDLLSHLVRSAMLAGRMIFEVGRDLREAFEAMQASALHDAGKLEILEDERAAGKPDGPRRRVLRSHPVRGERKLLETLLRFPGVNGKFWRAASVFALSHHERFSGRGYPAGLGEDHIPTALRLMSFADEIDAMASWRHYQNRRSVEQALTVLFEDNPDDHDPLAWDLFMRIFPASEEFISRGFRERVETSRREREAALAARMRPALEILRVATGASGASEGEIKPTHIGSMSNVYKLNDPLTGRPIAVKVPSSPDIIPTMQREARVFQLAHAALSNAAGGPVPGFRVPGAVIITDEIGRLLPGIDLSHATAYDYIEGTPLPEHGQMSPGQYAAFRAGLRELNRRGIFFTDPGIPFGQNIAMVGADVVIIDGLLTVPAVNPDYPESSRKKDLAARFADQESYLETTRILADLFPPDPPGADYTP